MYQICRNVNKKTVGIIAGDWHRNDATKCREKTRLS